MTENNLQQFLRGAGYDVRPIPYLGTKCVGVISAMPKKGFLYGVMDALITNNNFDKNKLMQALRSMNHDKYPKGFIYYFPNEPYEEEL